MPCVDATLYALNCPRAGLYVYFELETKLLGATPDVTLTNTGYSFEFVVVSSTTDEPPDAFVQDVTPEPFVVKTCPEVPGPCGNVSTHAERFAAVFSVRLFTDVASRTTEFVIPFNFTAIGIS
jgi:hypothetical protein